MSVVKDSEAGFGREALRVVEHNFVTPNKIFSSFQQTPWGYTDTNSKDIFFSNIFYIEKTFCCSFLMSELHFRARPPPDEPLPHLSQK